MTLENGSRPGGDEAEVFTIRVRALGEGGATFAIREVYVVVPREGGTVTGL